jgi:hypothetical protein
MGRSGSVGDPAGDPQPSCTATINPHIVRAGQDDANPAFEPGWAALRSQLSAIRALCSTNRTSGPFGDERGNSCCLKSSPILALAPT